MEVLLLGVGVSVTNEAKWNVQQLRNFEEKVAQAFNSGKILAPVHLTSDNESSLLAIFEKIEKRDWIFCSWRSHYHCLLKGVPEDLVMSSILNGKSIALCFPEYRVFSSAIVGGTLPIALGVALSIKLMNQDVHVWCFIGDTTAETGIASSCQRYASNHNLPITFVVEDNNQSVCTNTREVWNTQFLSFSNQFSDKVITYEYKSKFPHAGAGKRVQF